MPKDLEEKFKLYCEAENLEVNQNQIDVIKKLQDYFNQNFTSTFFKIFKKKSLKKEQYNSNLNFFKTLLTSLVVILIFSVLPSTLNFVKINLKSNEVVFNSSKQNFDEILDKQNKKNKIIKDSIKDRYSWNIFEDIDVFGKDEEDKDPQRLSASTIEELFKQNGYNLDNVKKIECVYPLTAGMTSKIIQKSINSSLSIVDDLPEWIPDEVISKNNWPNWKDSIYQMHNPKELDDSEDDTKYIERLVFDELFSQQLTIRLIKNKISHKNGVSLPNKNTYSKMLREKLDFKLTNDQEKTIQEISHDQCEKTKMLRLLQGDVGSGKTIVALFAMMQCMENKKKSILMAPTEILAEQHFNTIQGFISEMNIACSLITSSTKDNHDFNADIIIGTHALFQKSVNFSNIGLVVIDEQHKFGVHQRILLNEKAGNSCDILLMTATPIPRTMELAAYGDMDISKIKEKPKNRKDIITKSINAKKIEELKESLLKVLNKNQKIYWVLGELLEKVEHYLHLPK